MKIQKTLNLFKFVYLESKYDRDNNTHSWVSNF